jgi:serine/threonine protein kinase
MIKARCLHPPYSCDYEHLHFVSRRPGRASRIKFARNPKNYQKIAVKEYSMLSFRDEQFRYQLGIVSGWNHPCLSRVLSWRDLPDSSSIEVHTEWAQNGSLESLLKCWREFPPPIRIATEKAKTICGIVLGMRFIDSRGLEHRNLKPSNILIDHSGHPLIDDLVSSCYEVDKSIWVTDPHNSAYAAPEVLSGNPHTSSSAVFSFGLLLYEILIGPIVFSSESGYMPFLRQIMDEVTQIPAGCGLLMQNLIRQCWFIEPKFRPTFQAMFSTFEGVDFDIVPGADSAAIRDYVADVLLYEGKIDLRVGLPDQIS